ncbi:hypothetical protein ACFLW4_02435 [Chloroflexota bacterium]
MVNTKDKEAFAVYATDQDEAVDKMIKAYESDRMPLPDRENTRTLEIGRIFDLTEEGKFQIGSRRILYFHNGIPPYKAPKAQVKKKETANEG